MSSYIIEAMRRRRVFFSFHYEDIMRVNNVRMCGEFKTSSSDQSNKRSIEGFYDGSLWESRKRSGPESLKQLIREGVENTSTVCVLIGSGTWERRWVRYEIARSVIDKKGLLAVDINGINHHSQLTTHASGINPLDYIGVCTSSGNTLLGMTYHLYEKDQSGSWIPYKDYTTAVSLPAYMPSLQQGYVIPLSFWTKRYSVFNHNLIGAWIDEAATAAGR